MLAYLDDIYIVCDKQDVAGTSWDEDVKQVGFEYVYVADAAKDDASSINAALQSGYHIVISPGIYKLDAPIVPTCSASCTPLAFDFKMALKLRFPQARRGSTGSGRHGRRCWPAAPRTR